MRSRSGSAGRICGSACDATCGARSIARGGNDNADAAHFIRQIDDTHNVVLDELGPGHSVVRALQPLARQPVAVSGRWQGNDRSRKRARAIRCIRRRIRCSSRESLFPQGLNYTWSADEGRRSFVDADSVRDAICGSRMAVRTTAPATSFFGRCCRGWSCFRGRLKAGERRARFRADVIELDRSFGHRYRAARGDVERGEGHGFAASRDSRAIVWQSNAGPTMIRRIAFRVPDEVGRRVCERAAANLLGWSEGAVGRCAGRSVLWRRLAAARSGSGIHREIVSDDDST